MEIICCGQIASGKDIIADYLVSKLPHGWKKLALAHNVKKIFCKTFNVTKEFVEEWKRRKDIPEGFNQTVRESLIFIGDGFRKISSHIWINLLKNELNTNNYIIADGRYINEIKFIKERGGLSILVWRPGHENTIGNDSEQQLVEYRDVFIKRSDDGYIANMFGLFDFFIVNDGILEQLYKKLDEKVLPVIIERLNNDQIHL